MIDDVLYNNIKSKVESVVGSMVKSDSLTMEDALTIALGSIAHAREINVNVTVSVLDSSAVELLFLKMDNALLISTTLAPKKAYTSVVLKAPTSEVKSMIDSSLHLLESSMDSKIVAFGGGIPIIKEGKLLGAVGVSGGSIEEDIKIAKAGIDLFLKS